MKKSIVALNSTISKSFISVAFFALTLSTFANHGDQITVNDIRPLEIDLSDYGTDQVPTLCEGEYR